ncbi:MAG: hypothetical protein KDI07_06040 [Anaerolineae bacterium]|nr:hypothetical protein [Anaerolineae bacterium]MCB9129339.1 hypothetical protein [Anaerolineales bacterium]MCB0227765.1 hypothetical protein [Anaerolineae bacterium]MCB0235025.1 hypothetical protein [Anaerolineae bacterium]MCB0237960.1 hypothetical protein [Anaerolineae bacterium]
MLILGYRFDAIHGGMAACIFFLYIFCLFTVAPVTFRKGYKWFGIIGFVLPVFWFWGATRDAKPGSYIAQHQALGERERMSDYTN